MRITVITSELIPIAEWVRDVWKRRSLLYRLSSRDITIRYRQSLVGVLWALLQPLAMMAVVVVVFERFARESVAEVPYYLFVLAGIVPWSFFSQAVGKACLSLVENGTLIKRTYFPRVYLPLGKVLSFVPDLAIGLALFGSAAFFAGYSVNLRLLLLPIIILCLWGLTAGLGSGLAIIHSRYRDVGHAVPVLLQVWFFASPIIYPASFVPDSWMFVYALNPMFPLVETLRWSFLDTPLPTSQVFLESWITGLIIGLGGLATFRRLERNVADVI